MKLFFEETRLTIKCGDKVVGITGANGCGKSSLYALILGDLENYVTLERQLNETEELRLLLSEELEPARCASPQQRQNRWNR
jgi:ATPase subunit of ABC transporter with duplicated ATPase domains